ncbi:MAG: hypothetical protein ACI9R3_001213 [Verrucomicrobiales bacterium]|jgi:hypothetical protein
MTPTTTFPIPVSDALDSCYTNTLADSRGVRLISRITACLVLLLALGAFVMSFDALHALAADSGAIAPQFAYLFPICVDGAILVFSISALRASLCAEPTRVPMLLVVAVTTLSVVLNVCHAPFALITCIMAGSRTVRKLDYNRSCCRLITWKRSAKRISKCITPRPVSRQRW